MPGASGHRRVYVVGAYLPNGGTYMAYHLGRLVQQVFGHTAFAVRMSDERADGGIQDYDVVYPTVSLAEMESEIRPDDLLIANASFSQMNFGLRLNCRKLMYIQHFNSFSLLDVRFDRYVCVSDFVRDVIFKTYGMQPPVIPAFVSTDDCEKPLPWADRPAHRVLVHRKGDAALQTLLFERLQACVKAQVPHIRLESLSCAALSHRDLVARLGRYRYLVTLAAAEGFGMIPLEAMAMGTLVVGFDGFGGRQYMRPESNCLIAAYPDVEAVARHLIRAAEREQAARNLADNGRATAAAFDYRSFRDAWIAELKSWLDGAGAE